MSRGKTVVVVVVVLVAVVVVIVLVVAVVVAVAVAVAVAVVVSSVVVILKTFVFQQHTSKMFVPGRSQQLAICIIAVNTFQLVDFFGVDIL